MIITGIEILVLIVLLPFVIRRMAESDICFTFPFTNHIKYAEKGGSRDQNGKWSGGILDHYIPEVPGYILEGPNLKEMAFRLARSGEKQKVSAFNALLYRLLGVYWYGLYPFKHIKEFGVPRETEKLEGRGPADWIERKGIAVVTALRFTFPRPFVYTDVELGDRLKVSLKLVLKLRVVRPYTPVYEFNDDFFTQTGSILQGQVIDELKNFATINDFITVPKGEVGGFLKKYKKNKPDGTPSDLNLEMAKQVGLGIDGISINDWMSDKKITDAIEQQAIETAEGDARITKATKDKQVTITNAEAYQEKVSRETDADVARQKALAGSRMIYIRDTVAALASSLGEPNVVASGAADVLEMEAATSGTSKLTTLIKDRSPRSPVVVPVGGDKK